MARDFDVLAFSVSFEWDYTNVVTMLRLAGVPVRAEARTARVAARRACIPPPTGLRRADGSPWRGEPRH
jgi:hypothetical protein